MSGVALELSRVAVELGGQRVLGPLDLALDAGEYVCVLGASGSGKSTLLRTVAGLETPSAGTVRLGDRVVSEDGRQLVRPERRGVGMLFQEGALWPHMSVERTLAFTLSCCGVPRAARSERIDELLERVRLVGYRERMPATLSGGEAQRLALARALAPDPGILLLDEPLGPLDAELRDELCAALRELHEQLGFTALHVTHDATEPAKLGARSLRLDAGLWKEIDA